LTDAGLYDEARAALVFFIEAEADRYRFFEELGDHFFEPYGVSLTRYHGFGIEESDTSCNGDFNFEFDGFGLFLWALRHYVAESGDTTILTDHWDVVRDTIADPLVALVEEDTGLLRADSSIWEVHWLGKEKHFAYTNITAVRGLCDASALAGMMSEAALAVEYAEAGATLREAIVEHLIAPEGGVAQDVEELAAGTGYWDAAVVEAIAMGLFDPEGVVATDTLARIRSFLTVPVGVGLMRNDDEFDGHELTPYGGPYDSQEWIFIDYRTSIAARHMAEDEYADALQSWVRDQTLLNYLLIGENYDGTTGEYRNNAPMIGFGAGSYITAMRQRAGDWAVDPACGGYFDETVVGPVDDDAELDHAEETADPDPVEFGADVSADAPMEEPDVADAPDESTRDPRMIDDHARPRGGADDTDSAAEELDDGCGCTAGHARSPGWIFGLGIAIMVLRRRRF
jgi:GH15 family glucan-1,4-alpha-glucosidase